MVNVICQYNWIRHTRTYIKSIMIQFFPNAIIEWRKKITAIFAQITKKRADIVSYLLLYITPRARVLSCAHTAFLALLDFFYCIKFLSL